jgi:hypothetical protein
MSADIPRPIRQEFSTFGLPVGTVRGFLSVLICSFFWIFLLVPDRTEGIPPHAPLGHFFLLTLVLMAFASHPLQELNPRHFLPWLMRVIFVGGSIAVLVWAGINHPDRLSTRLTPDPAEVSQWPVLLACLAGGFGVALFLRFVLGRNSNFFMTLRAWIGVIAILLLLAETLFQFVILPNMSDKPSLDAMKVWEGLLIAVVAAYFGTRA